jgi:hypothetical protein
LAVTTLFCRNLKKDKMKITEEFFNQVSDSVYQYVKEELPDANSPYHFEAEIWSGMQSFLLWLENKAEIKE